MESGLPKPFGPLVPGNSSHILDKRTKCYYHRSVKHIKVLLVILLLQLVVFYPIAINTHNYDYCGLSNDWHWSDSENDAIRPTILNCPNMAIDNYKLASRSSVFKHRTLQILAVTIPMTAVAAIVVVFHGKKK